MANYNLTQTGDEVQAYIDSIPVIDVTGTLSGSTITFGSNPYSQIAANYAADCGSVVRLTVGTAVYLLRVTQYDGTNYTAAEMSGAHNVVATIGSSSASATIDVGIDATPTQGSNNLVKSDGVWSEVNALTTIKANEDTIFSSYYINKDTGELVSGAATSQVYKYLGIIPNNTYFISGYTGANVNTCLGAWYTESGTFISSFVPSTGVATNYTDIKQIAPANASQLCVFGNSTSVLPSMFYSVNEKVAILDAEIKELNESLSADVILTPVARYNSKYINKNTGELVSGQASSYVLEFNITDASKPYLASGRIGANTNTCLVGYYTSTNEFISSQFGSSGTATVYTKERLTVPPNCQKIRVFGYSLGGTDYPAELYIEQSLPESVDNINSQIKCKNQRKTIGVFGGSLSVNSESQTAKSIWREKLDVDVTDYGVAGAGFSSLQGTSIQTQVDGATSKDIYILWASTNDYRNNRDCGTWKDYTEEDNYDSSKLVTQCGGINYCIKKLLTINPNAEIYFFLPLRFFSMESGYNPFSDETNTTGKTFSEYIEEMEKCCEYYGVPMLNQYKLQGVNIFNKSLYYKTDNIHMNNAGYEKIGWLQAEFLANGR